MESTTTTDPGAPRPAEAAPAAAPAIPPAAHRKEGPALLYIAAFKLAKALLFFAAAAGLFRMVHKDTGVEVSKILRAVRIDGDSKFAKEILVKVNVIDDPKKKIFGFVLSFYGILFAVEGVGLFMRKRWAEYFTVIMTASAIPLELYELFHRAEAKVVQKGLVPDDQHASFFLANRTTGLKLALLIVNVAILWYLIDYLRRHKPPPEVKTLG